MKLYIDLIFLFTSVLYFSIQLINISKAFKIIKKQKSPPKNDYYSNYKVTISNQPSKALYYKELNVSEGESKENIKKAYRKLVIKYHPDKNLDKSSEDLKKINDKFLKIQEAYDFIMNGVTPQIKQEEKPKKTYLDRLAKLDYEGVEFVRKFIQDLDAKMVSKIKAKYKNKYGYEEVINFAIDLFEEKKEREKEFQTIKESILNDSYILFKLKKINFIFFKHYLFPFLVLILPNIIYIISPILNKTFVIDIIAVIVFYQLFSIFHFIGVKLLMFRIYATELKNRNLYSFRENIQILFK